MPTVQEILRRVGVPRERGVTDPTEQTETINEIIKCLTALRDTTEPRPMPTPFERRVDAAASRTFGLPVGLTPGQGELLNSPMTAVKAQGNLNPTTNIVSVKLSTDWLGTGVVGNAFNVYLLPSLWG
ncbi:MAG: hypothetical protein IMZ62_16595, partial [Chloroflexi bacterium]|nr:hypothetical protein [Chloroflexota bacterium]